MKKIYLLSFALFSLHTAFKAQSVIEVKDQSNSVTVINNGIIYSTTTAGAASTNNFEVKNIGTTSQTIVIKKFDDLINTISSSDMADSYFCTGTTCYPPTTFSATVVLAPNATTILAADLDEASAVGESHIRYKIYVSSNTTDELNFTVKYNNALAVKNNSMTFASVSEVYPNPSASKSFISMSLNTNLNNVEVTVINSLGSIVSTKSIDLQTGKNIITVDSENLPTGLYFVSIYQGNQRITKKLTISK